MMVKRRLPGILIAFCIAAGTHAPAQVPQLENATLRRLYDAAQQSRKAGNLGQAAEDFRAFLAEALDELANSRAQIGDYSEASALYGDALALAPSSPSLHRDYAAAALQFGDLNSAEAQARELLNHDQGDSKGLAQAHQILGRTLHRMNRNRDARKELETAVSLDPSFENQYDLGVVCLDLDDENCAVRIFGQIEATYPDTPALHMQLGRAYGDSDFTPRAVEEFRKAITEDPHFPEAHYSLAAALLAGSEDQKILEEAEKELKEELAISPHDFLTYAALGKIAAGSRRYPEAEKYLKQAISLNPTSPDAYLYLGQMCFDTNRPAEAEANLRKAIQLTTDDSRNRYQIQKAHFLLGRILMQQRRPEAAHAEMQIARALTNKTLSEDRSELAGLLEDNSAAAGAPHAPAGPATPSPSTPHSAAPASVNRQKAFERLLTPAVADSYNDLGVILAVGKDYAAAANSFANAAHWNPRLAGLDLNWGRAAFSASKFADAVAPLTRYVQSHPQDSNIRAPLGISQYMTGDYSGCVKTLAAVVQQFESIPQIAYVYADSLARTGRQAEGIARLVAIEKQHPEIADVHHALSDAYKSTSQYQKAEGELLQYNALIAPHPSNTATGPAAGAKPRNE
jgi:tetratricopeptide (TPR) repeat protein